LTEIAEATWGEIDLKKKLWTLPAHRIKNKEDDHDVRPRTRFSPATTFCTTCSGSATPIGPADRSRFTASAARSGDNGHDRERAEKSLAHAFGNKVEILDHSIAAYRKT
jgi:hypothetical protein